MRVAGMEEMPVGAIAKNLRNRPEKAIRDPGKYEASGAQRGAGDYRFLAGRHGGRCAGGDALTGVVHFDADRTAESPGRNRDAGADQRQDQRIFGSRRTRLVPKHFDESHCRFLPSVATRTDAGEPKRPFEEKTHYLLGSSLTA